MNAYPYPKIIPFWINWGYRITYIIVSCLLEIKRWINSFCLSWFIFLSMIKQDIPIFQGEISFYEEFFTKSESDHLYTELLDKIDWKQEYITLFGKTHPQPRLTAWYADSGKSYTYSNLKWEPQAWNSSLLYIKKRVEEVIERKFNSVLLNLYRNGKDSMGWHSDDEPELGKNPLIASVSFGQERRFHLRHKNSKEVERIRMDLTHGSLLTMGGSTQHFWQHQIPKTAKKVKPRINLTFRIIE